MEDESQGRVGYAERIVTGALVAVFWLAKGQLLTMRRLRSNKRRADPAIEEIVVDGTHARGIHQQGGPNDQGVGAAQIEQRG